MEYGNTMEINGPKERHIPPPRRGSPGRPAVYRLDDLGIDDSRLFTGNPRNIASAVCRQAQRLGITIVTRREGDGLRVWRIRAGA